MSRTRVVMNVDGYNAFRNSPSVTDATEQAASGIAERFSGSVEAFGSRVGIPTDSSTPDAVVRVSHSASRVRVYVSTGSVRARLAEARDRLLLQAVGR